MIKKIALLTILYLTGCIATPKYNGVQELLENHPKGAVDARDASPESKLFIKETLLYINSLEYELERPR